MLAGIGILIMAGQFHVAVDGSPKGSGIKNLMCAADAIFHGLFPINGSPQEMAALIALLTIVVMLGWNKYRPEGLKFFARLADGAAGSSRTARCAHQL